MSTHEHNWLTLRHIDQAHAVQVCSVCLTQRMTEEDDHE